VIQFEARFDGVIWQITVPVVAIAALYAQENGRGMVFDEQETEGSGEENPPPTATPPSKPGRPQLKIVK
jgi:stringent starvation protein B